MTISQVQKKAATSAANATSLAVTLDGNPTEGNLLVLVAGASGGGTETTLTPPDGYSAAIDGGGTTCELSIWYKVAGAGESATATFTSLNSVRLNCILFEYSGCATESPFDQSASANSGSGTVSSQTTGTTPTTSEANELLVAGISNNNQITTYANAWTNSFVQQADLDGRFTAAARIVSSTGAFETTESWTTARRAVGAIATFKAAEDGGTTPVGRSLEGLWNVLASVGRSNQGVYNVRSLVGRSVQGIYNVRALVGRSVQGLWDVRVLVGRSVEGLWNVLSPLASVGRSLVGTWNVRATAGRSVEGKWHVRSLAGRALEGLHNVRSIVSRDNQGLWGVRALAGRSIAGSWKVRSLIGRSLQGLWNTLSDLLPRNTSGLSVSPNTSGLSVPLPTEVSMTLKQSSISTEYVYVAVSATFSDDEDDVTTLTARIAFVTEGTEPVEDDWRDADWSETGARAFTLLSAGELEEGRYNVWLELTDNPEIPAMKAPGVLVIT